jgi:hypothetical protein
LKKLRNSGFRENLNLSDGTFPKRLTSALRGIMPMFPGRRAQTLHGSSRAIVRSEGFVMRFLAAALLMCSVSAPALAQVSQDTLAEAVDSAIGNNPELMAQRKIREFANENLNQAEAQMGPQVNLNGVR